MFCSSGGDPFGIWFVETEQEGQEKPVMCGLEKEARAAFHAEVKRQIASENPRAVYLLNPDGNWIMTCACRVTSVEIVPPPHQDDPDDWKGVT